LPVSVTAESDAVVIAVQCGNPEQSCCIIHGPVGVDAGYTQGCPGSRIGSKIGIRKPAETLVGVINNRPIANGEEALGEEGWRRRTGVLVDAARVWPLGLGVAQNREAATEKKKGSHPQREWMRRPRNQHQ
jgi:hypothetical protein